LLLPEQFFKRRRRRRTVDFDGSGLRHYRRNPARAGAESAITVLAAIICLRQTIVGGVRAVAFFGVC
jgi:hypothetical protein